MVIGRAGYVAGGIIMNQLKPRMLNADGWNWGAKSGFFFLGFDIAFFIYLFFYLPETRNRTTAEIEYMFQAKIPCRKFRSHVIDREYPSAECDSGTTLTTGSRRIGRGRRDRACLRLRCRSPSGGLWTGCRQ